MSQTIAISNGWPVGETESVDTGMRELCLVVLCGSVDVTVAGRTFSSLGTRTSVFDPVSPAAVYVPPGHSLTLRCEPALAPANAATIALALDPAGARFFDDATEMAIG